VSIFVRLSPETNVSIKRACMRAASPLRRTASFQARPFEYQLPWSVTPITTLQLVLKRPWFQVTAVTWDWLFGFSFDFQEGPGNHDTWLRGWTGWWCYCWTSALWGGCSTILPKSIVTSILNGVKQRMYPQHTIADVTSALRPGPAEK